MFHKAAKHIHKSVNKLMPDSESDDRQSHAKDFRNTVSRPISIMTPDMPDVESTVTYPHLILPGELLSTILSQPLKLGPGLRHSTSPQGETLIQATQAGLLHQTKNSEFYVDYNSRRVPLLPLTTPSSQPLCFRVVSRPNGSTFPARGNQ